MGHCFLGKFIIEIFVILNVVLRFLVVLSFLETVGILFFLTCSTNQAFEHCCNAKTWTDGQEDRADSHFVITSFY